MEGSTALNQAYFDNEAANYDSKHEKAAAEIVKRVQARTAFIGVQWVEDDVDTSDDDDEERDEKGTERKPKSVRLLDYACGTGAMSRALAPYTTQCIGIDLSEKMVEAYNTRARNQGLSEDEMLAYHGNICAPIDENPEAFRDSTKFFDFDVVCVGLGFHHFDDPGLAAKRLVQRLRSGGVLVIIDFLPHGPHHQDNNDGQHGHSHDHQGSADSAPTVQKAMKTVTHHGFSEESIKQIFVEAGAGRHFAIDVMGEVTMGTHMGKRTLFMARGTKA